MQPQSQANFLDFESEELIHDLLKEREKLIVNCNEGNVNNVDEGLTVENIETNHYTDLNEYVRNENTKQAMTKTVNVKINNQTFCNQNNEYEGKILEREIWDQEGIGRCGSLEIMNNLDSYFSKESISLESESPITNIPIPISPDIQQLDKFNTEVTAPQLSIAHHSDIIIKKEDKKDLWERISPEYPQDESIDSFITNKGNQFFDVLKNKDNKDQVLTDNRKWTPIKEYNGALWYSPSSSSNLNRTYIKSIKQTEKNPPKEDLGRKSLNRKSESNSPNQVKSKRMYKMKIEMNKNPTKIYRVKNDEIGEWREERKENNLLELITEKVAPLLTLIQNRNLSKSVERDLSKVAGDYRNDKPLRFATPKPTSRLFEISTDTQNEFQIQKKLDPEIVKNQEENESKKKIEEDKLSDENCSNGSKDAKVNDSRSISSSDEDTISLNETKLSPNKQSKFDILDQFMSPQNSDEVRNRSQSENVIDWIKGTEYVSKEVWKEGKYESPLLSDNPRVWLTSRKKEGRNTVIGILN